jgi:hypothetical protein
LRICPREYETTTLSRALSEPIEKTEPDHIGIV